MRFLQLFGRLRSAVIGMVHVKALPGSSLNTLLVVTISEEACREAEVYSAAGIDGLIIENMHDLPYALSVGPEVTAAMAAVCIAVRQVCPSPPLEIQILSAANQQALAVALAAGIDFIRAEGFVFSHIADEGLLNVCAGDQLRYRKQIGAEHIQIFTDIKKQHSSHASTSDISLSETAKAAEFFLSDGVVLTGTATGMQADLEELREVQQNVRIPVIIGSGVTYKNVVNYMEASAMIIGSHFKKGYWANSVDPERVKKFMEKIHKFQA
ncbi:uncharacterized protein F13E9.13, mitochondrial [Latimeria chalumnae]|uniref:uncharacterized protein F13E9.13, mitochondrial n=1 Tax=Latimeria chalumnae TaxID=7897 RepID=UPI0006D92E89|nr:PREDICTED: uncharacterized protein F13E9.13, mitochondrial-like [Latimeria chalumnae]|eukprot:XP_014344458.1 PREDICTED: uncharacterized protein F13E9.13, mitochondrial-like [Latimeria chalumnae]